MSLADIYYLTAIIFMWGFIVLMIFIGFLGWKLYLVVKEAPQEIQNKIVNILDSRKSQIAGAVGVAVSSFIFSKVKDMFKGKK
jgi:hypothetical protein